MAEKNLVIQNNQSLWISVFQVGSSQSKSQNADHTQPLLLFSRRNRQKVKNGDHRGSQTILPNEPTKYLCLQRLAPGRGLLGCGRG